MLSSNGQMSEQEKKDGCLHGSIAKPFRQSQVLDLTMEVMSPDIPESAAPTIKPGKKEISSAFSHNYQLLLVEDNPVNQKVALAMLKKIQLTNIDLAENGRQAVEMSADKQYDAVLMDCQMPEMSGYEATEAIREREKSDNTGLHLKIIAMTANAMEGDREKCINAGMDDYITKPIKIETLQNTLLGWLEDQ